MKINEITTSSTQRIIDTLEQECGPYLQEIGGLENALIKYPLYRGGDNVFTSNSPIVKIPVRQDRQPRSTSIEDHELADKWFKEHSSFGIPYRSAALFCTGSQVIATAYTRYYPEGTGISMIVLPVGEYHYCWSPEVQDMFSEIHVLSFSTDEPVVISNFLDKSGYEEDTRLTRAIASKHEIMLHCKEAILIQRTFVDDFRAHRLEQK